MITNNLEKAAEVLNENEVIALPTETVYGLAGNAFQPEAIKKIFELKKRPLFNPLIVHLHSASQLEEVATDIPEKAWLLAKKFWPGPLTLVLKKKNIIPDLVTAGKDTVAVRIPNHPMALELLKKLPFPLVAPSANPFGSISPTSAKHVWNYFNDKVKIILDGGNCDMGLESTIIGFEGNAPTLYRYGTISVEEIENTIGKLSFIIHSNEKPQAPGMLSRHYAPTTETVMSENLQESIRQFQNKKIGVLVFKNKQDHHHILAQEILSPNGNLSEAARNLYAALHRLDQLKLEVIIVEKFPDDGLGKTINDRLNRAVKK